MPRMFTAKHCEIVSIEPLVEEKICLWIREEWHDDFHEILERIIKKSATVLVRGSLLLHWKRKLSNGIYKLEGKYVCVYATMRDYRIYIVDVAPINFPYYYHPEASNYCH